MTDQTRRLLDLYTDYLLVSFGQATATELSALLPDVVSWSAPLKPYHKESESPPMKG